MGLGAHAEGAARAGAPKEARVTVEAEAGSESVRGGSGGREREAGRGDPGAGEAGGPAAEGHDCQEREGWLVVFFLVHSFLSRAQATTKEKKKKKNQQTSSLPVQDRGHCPGTLRVFRGGDLSGAAAHHA